MRPILPPKYTFAPTRLPTITAANSIDSFAYSQDEATKSRCYGLLGGIGARVTLGLDEVGRVVRIVGKELDRRGESELCRSLIEANPSLDYSHALLQPSTRAQSHAGTRFDTIVSGRSAVCVRS